MHKFYICLIICLTLFLSRLIPHPPNFTPLIAMAIYIPVLLGMNYLPILILSYAFTDLIIGYHTGTHWTWGSIFFIGICSVYFSRNLYFRLAGSLLGALVFFILTNLGVWFSGMYDYSLNGIIECYVLALPFFTSSLISTFVFSLIFEFINYSFISKLKISKF